MRSAAGTRCLALLLFVIVSTSSPLYSTWRLLDARSISSMDFLPNGRGLVAVNLPAPHLEIWNTSSGVGVFATSHPITSVVVVDAAHAWCSVRGDGLYYSWDGWQSWNNVLAGLSLRVVYASNGLVEFNKGSALQYSTDAATFLPTTGILPGDSVTSMDRISSKILVAAAVYHLYRSTDGGVSWTQTRSDPGGGSLSVYVDPSNGYAFAGGDTARVSRDSGATWVSVQAGLFPNLAGQIVGSHDCSGVWYLTPNYFRGSLLRTQSHGDYLQDVGPASASSLRMTKCVVIDRGSSFYWLDFSGLLWLDSTGLDGSITQPAAASISTRSPSSVENDICSAAATNFTLEFNYTNCDTIAMDSIAILSTSGTIGFTNPHVVFSNVASAVVNATYIAKKKGVDSVRLRAWVHSKLDNKRFFKDIAFTALGIAAPAKLAIASPTISFGQTKVDSSRSSSVTLSNQGCEELRVDSVVSSDPQTFPVGKLSFPLTIKTGASINVTVSFHPHASGPFVEALEIGTSGGHQFIELRGTGAIAAGVGRSFRKTIAIYPNPVRNVLRIQSSSQPTHAIILDLLGRNVLDFNPLTTFAVDVSSLPAGAYFLSVAGTPPIPFIVAR